MKKLPIFNQTHGYTLYKKTTRFSGLDLCLFPKCRQILMEQRFQRSSISKYRLIQA